MPRKVVLAAFAIVALLVIGWAINTTTPPLGIVGTLGDTRAYDPPSTGPTTTHAYDPVPAGDPTTTHAVDELPAKVVKVTDGDTVHVRDQEGAHTVRVLGIDTPETVKPRTPVQCYGPEASAQTKKLLPVGAQVMLRFEGPTEDRYGRLLAFVETPEGDDLSEQLAYGGFARVYPMSSRYRVKETPHLLELQASAKQRGA